MCICWNFVVYHHHHHQPLLLVGVEEISVYRKSACIVVSEFSFFPMNKSIALSPLSLTWIQDTSPGIQN